MPINTSALAHPKDPDARRQQRSARKAKADAFRVAVWTRDLAQCRATGVELFQSHVSPTQRGNCCHLQSKGAHPERKYDVTNAVLMSEWAHIQSYARGGRVLRLTDPFDGTPATDASRPIRFTLYNKAGAVVWTRVS